MEKVANRSNDEDDEDEDDEDWDEADDDGKIYKNPRNSPSADCPRDEEQATLLVTQNNSYLMYLLLVVFFVYLIYLLLYQFQSKICLYEHRKKSWEIVTIYIPNFTAADLKMAKRTNEY